MARKQILFQRQLPTILIPLVAGMALFPKMANGQIVPDDTLGEESSTVRQDNVKGIDSDIIEGGATRGANLFHSFAEFNVEAERGAYFANSDAIDNILSRVTGSNISKIMGTLGVLNGDANLFLINPNGIMFGENARLDVGGSFFASTADSLLFDNGFEFSGSNPEAPPLLTVNIPVGLGFRDNPGSIKNQSVSEDVGLQVPTGETLALIGGDVSFDGGKITAPGGKVELGGLAASGTLKLNNDSSLSFPDEIERADLKLTNNADVNVRAGGGGFITFNSRSIELSEGSDLLAGIKLDMGSPNAEAGDITINSTGSVSLTNGSQLSIGVRGQGNGGNVIINAKDKVSFDGVDSDGFPSAAFSTIREEGKGNAGNIEIKAASLNLLNGGRLETSTRNQGNAGNITIDIENAVTISGLTVINEETTLFSQIASILDTNAQGKPGIINIKANSLTLENGAEIDNSTFGKGNAGNLILNVDGAVDITGGTIFSNVEAGGVGDGGKIIIDVQSLSLIDGAQLQTLVRQADETIPAGRGNAGNINIQVDDALAISGVGSDGFASLISSELESGATGSAGNINILTGSLSLNGEANSINSSTSGEGDAGNVTIKAEGAVELVGGDIFSNVEREGVGEGGKIIIDVQSLSLIDGAQLQTLVRQADETIPAGRGNAGNINIQVDDALAISGVGSDGFASLISSELESGATGSAGNINILTGSLSLNGEVNSIASSTSGQGDAGNVTIEAEDAVELVGGDIFSNVEHEGVGEGGNITIKGQSLSLIDGAQLQTLIREADETNSAGRGNAGNILIDVDGEVNISGKDANDNFSAIFSSLGTGAEGKAGDIDVKARSLSLEAGAAIDNSSSGQGNAGNININVSDAVTISGFTVVDEETTRFSNVRNDLFEGAIGNAGNIEVTASSLTLENEGFLSSSTFGQGNAGNVIINATESITFNFGSAFSSVAENGKGQGGNIEILTPKLELLNGAELQADTEGQGDAGNIRVDASDSVILSGVAPYPKLEDGRAGGFSSGFLSSTEAGAKGQGGEIRVNTNRLQISDGAVLNARSQSDFQGGNIEVNANVLEVTGGGQILTTAFSNGNTGNINLNISDRISLSGSDSTFFDRLNQVTEAFDESEAIARIDPVSPESGIFANTKSKSTGDGGKIQIDTAQLLVSDGAQISASTSGAGKGGELTIHARQEIELRGTGLKNFDDAIRQALETDGNVESLQKFLQEEAPFSTAAFSIGEAGTIKIDSPSLVLRDGAILSSTTFGDGDAGGIGINAQSLELFGSGLVAGTFNSDSAASGGNINIDTGKLSLQDGGRILTTTFGNGEGGYVKVKASEFVELGSTPADVILPTTINTSSVFGTGKAGNVTIKSPKLMIRDGAQIVTTSGSNSLPDQIKRGGEGGNINVIASESIEISGTSPKSKFSSALTAESFSDSAAGNINIETRSLFLNNGAKFTVNSEGTGSGGSIELTADNLSLNNNSEISATTTSGEGGNINLEISDILLLENNSPITAEAKGTGNGGNIDIAAELTILKESDIMTDAIKGKGGNINITTQGLFQRNSDITASSEKGVDGVVRLNTPEIDPSQGLVELPAKVQNPNQLIAQDACKLGKESSLVVTGRGGLPPSSSQDFNSNWVDVDLIQPIFPEEQSPLESNQEANSVSSLDAASQNQRIPAEGWVVNEKGEVFLVAYKSGNANSQRQHNRDYCQPK